MIDTEAQAYIDGIDPQHRPLFDRVHELILGLHPDVNVVIAYKMPTYVVGESQLHVAVWKHGVSFYGWREDSDAGFSARHPDLSSGRGTLRLRPADAAEIGDDELRDFLRAALSS